MMKFAEYTEKKSATQVAKELGVCAEYVRLLRLGARTPSLRVALRIEDWSKGQVKLESWRGNMR